MSLLNFIGIGNAIADVAQTAVAPAATTAAGAAPHGNPYTMWVMLAIFIVAFYFLLVRPQTKRAKEQKQMLGGIAVGDEVMTAGGMLGRIARMKDNYIVLTVAKGVDVTLQKGSIAAVLPKGTLEFTE